VNPVKKQKTADTTAKVLEVKNAEGKKVGECRLDPALFDGTVNTTLLYQAITMYHANQRQGNASTKTRAYVRGGGKKPWRQKGTGRARVGSIRSPLWRGGGIIFGPHPRDYSFTIPKKMKKIALLMAIDAKVKAGECTVLEGLSLQSPKTKELQALIKKAGLADKKTLLAVEAPDKNLALASRNIAALLVKPYQELNAYEVLHAHHLLMTKSTFEKLTHPSHEGSHDRA